VRAGYIRRVAAGIYAWLPLGQRVLRRIEAIVREEMDAAGAQEVLLPVVQPLELWQRSGRETQYGPLMFRLLDRKETGFCLAPTAEEVVTTVVAGEYGSYRDLPVNLYQIGWKYRDELRPRFGLLRTREFLMKDAYSFDADLDGLDRSYRTMYDAYFRVFERCALTFRAVEADSGEIGGDVSREFMAVASVGEDDFVWCPACDYAANVEAARRKVEAFTGAAPTVPAMTEIATPGVPGIDGVAELLQVERAALLKCLAFDVDGKLGLALVPGDREVNLVALEAALRPATVRLYTDDDFAANRALPRGYIGPHHPDVSIVVADPSVGAPQGWVTGSNKADHHVRDAQVDRDFAVNQWTEIATVVPGDPCPKCEQPLAIDRGIEVGHVFQLGAKYSNAFDATYTDDEGASHPMQMGCYGIGISRVLAAVVEQYNDEHGLAWPSAVAPYDVHIVVLPGRGEGAAAVIAAADTLVSDLEARGLAVLIDDRDVSAGIKFADADLLGMPVQLTVGAKGLGRGVVERKVRATGERDEIELTAVVDTVA
jgi:prolyl-tRNA synthetase